MIQNNRLLTRANYADGGNATNGNATVVTPPSNNRTYNSNNANTGTVSNPQNADINTLLSNGTNQMTNSTYSDATTESSEVEKLLEEYRQKQLDQINQKYNNHDVEGYYLSAKNNRENAIDSLYNAYMKEYETQKRETASSYDAAKRDAYLSYMSNAKKNEEALALQGLRESGYGETSRIYQNAEYQNNINNLNDASRKAVQALSDAMMNAENERLNKKYESTAAYYDALANYRTEKNTQKAQQLANADSSYYESLINYKLQQEQQRLSAQSTQETNIANYVANAIESGEPVSDGQKEIYKKYYGLDYDTQLAYTNPTAYINNYFNAYKTNSQTALEKYGSAKALKENVLGLSAAQLTANKDAISALFEDSEKNSDAYKYFTAMTSEEYSSSAKTFIQGIQSYKNNGVSFSDEDLCGSMVAYVCSGSFGAGDLRTAYKYYGMDKTSFSNYAKAYINTLKNKKAEGSLTDDESAIYDAVSNESYARIINDAGDGNIISLRNGTVLTNKVTEGLVSNTYVYDKNGTKLGGARFGIGKKVKVSVNGTTYNLKLTSDQSERFEVYEGDMTKRGIVRDNEGGLYVYNGGLYVCRDYAGTPRLIKLEDGASGDYEKLRKALGLA